MRGGRCAHDRALAGQEIACNVQHKGQDVGDHGHEEDKLGELVGAPCPLQVAAAVHDGEAGNKQTQDILLHDGRTRKHPRIDGRLARHDGQIRHAVAHAEQRLLDLLDPARVRPQGEVEQRADDDGAEQAAGQRRQVEARHGVRGGCAGSSRVGGGRSEAAVGQ